MPAEEFRQRVHDDVGAVVERPAQIGRRQRVVDDQRHARALGNRGHRLDVGDDPARIGDRFDEDRLGLFAHAALEARDVVGVGPNHVPAEVLEGVVELVDRATVELLRGDELLAGSHQDVHHHDLGGMPGGDREPGGAAFERRHPLFEHRVGRVADAGIDVAERLQPEQRRGVIDVVEHERRGLIDRSGAGAGRGIGLRAGVDRQRGKPGDAVGHGAVPRCRSDEPAIPGPGYGGWCSTTRRQRQAVSRHARPCAALCRGGSAASICELAGWGDAASPPPGSRLTTLADLPPPGGGRRMWRAHRSTG